MNDSHDDRAANLAATIAYFAEIEARQEQERISRRRPPGIDDWCNGLMAEVDECLAQLSCEHGEFCAHDGNLYPSLVGHYTYVLQAEGGGLVKIGRGQSASARAGGIQAMSPVRLRVVAVVQGGQLERVWHVQFYKARRHREWFAPEVADYFRNHGAPWCVRCAIYGDKTGVRQPLVAERRKWRPLAPKARK